MGRPLIRRLPRTDRASDHLLLNIEQKDPERLDLKIIATDQEHLFHGIVTHGQVESLRAGNYHGDAQEWGRILSYALLHKKSHDLAAGAVQNLEVVSAIKNNTATITIRRRGTGLVQRLGEITLLLDDEREEVAAFDWVDAAVETSDDLRSTCADLQASLDSQKSELNRLRAQLDELIEAKRSHDEELLAKFAALLNAKKLKIRDQQRLLSGVKTDITSALEFPEEEEAQPARKAGKSRGGKRKVIEASQQPSDEDMEDVMVPDSLPRQGRADDDADPMNTPDATEGETDSEDLNDDEPAVPVSLPEHVEEQAPTKKPVAPPPRRPLPFRKKSARAAESSRAQTADAHENNEEVDDEETDDEL